ncbi:MAG: DUF1993 domain-containing protein [Rhizomicrobium sp.]
MTISLFQISVPVFLRHLNALNGVLDKAAAFAEAKKFDQAVLLATRLYPDMYPLNAQVQQVSIHALRATALLAGVEQPDFGPAETTLAGLKDRVSRTIDFVKAATAAQIDGKEDSDIVVKFGTREAPFKALPFLTGFALPNFFFHTTTAYNILRSVGVEVGKRDFMGSPAS